MSRRAEATVSARFCFFEGGSKAFDWENQLRLFLVSLRDAYASHSLAETTFVFEFVRQRFELAEEQKVSLLDKHNSHIGNCFRRSSLGNFHKKICIGVLFSNASHCSHLFRVHFPLSVVVSGKILPKAPADWL